MPSLDVDLIGVEEAAGILSLHPRTVRHRIAAGDLKPALKAPGKTGAHLFERSYIEQKAEATS